MWQLPSLGPPETQSDPHCPPKVGASSANNDKTRTADFYKLQASLKRLFQLKGF